MPNLNRLHAALLRVTLSLSCWVQLYHTVTAMDVIIQDTDPSILYQPPTSWYPSSQLCTACLNPGVSTSYYEGVNIADQDDLSSSSDTDAHSSSISSSSHPAATSAAAPSQNLQVATATGLLSSPLTSKKATATSASPSPTSTQTEDNSNKGPGSSSSNSGSSGSSGSTPGGSGDRRRNIISRGDSDELNVTLSFNFTGTAIYLYGIQPQGVISGATGTPANINLTFTLDGLPVGNFSHLGSDGPNGPQDPSTSPQFVSNTAVFSKNALEDVPHQLVVHVGENSSFIFDYLVYSTNTTTNSSSTSTTPLAQTTPSPSVDPKVKKHNIATFGAVVGGVVGVLALFSLGLALSIIRRRRKAASRDRQDNESLHTNGSDDSPHMTGPAPFVPRFFPDTVIPTEPPTYMVALATQANNSTLLSSLTSSPYAPTTRSYADIPPSTPPPKEDAPLIPPPPPFPFPGMISIRPSPPNLPTGALPPSIPGESLRQQGSHNSDAVGTTNSNSASLPELVPLLLQHTEAQSVIRPLSRASSISYDINGNPLDDGDDHSHSHS